MRPTPLPIPGDMPSVRSLLTLFGPMAFSTWLGLLAAPVINAAVARSSGSPEAALAAYSVARNLIFLMSPFAVMVPTAVLVLVTGRVSRRRVRTFMALLGGGMAVMGLLILVVPVLRLLVFEILLGLNEELAERTRRSLFVLLLSPLVSIWRAFSQGLLIQRQRTSVMVFAGAAGFAVCFTGVTVARFFPDIPGEVYGAIMLVASVAMDALILQAAVLRSAAGAGGDDACPTYPSIFRYFLPLVLTTFVMAASGTAINAVLARTPDPAVSLAAYSVAASIVFTFESPVVVLRNTCLAYSHSLPIIRRLRAFCLIVGASVSLIVLVIGFTPIGPLLIRGAIGIGGRTSELALWCIRILSVSLVILSWRQFNYSLLMKRLRTDIIALSAVVRMVFLLVVLFAGLLILPDVRFAAAVYTMGFLIEAIITHFGAKRLGILSPAIAPVDQGLSGSSS